MAITHLQKHFRLRTFKGIHWYCVKLGFFIKIRFYFIKYGFYLQL